MSVMTDPATTSETDWEAHWRTYDTATQMNPGNMLRRNSLFRLLDMAGADEATAIADIGCGSGDLLADLARRYPNAVLAGLDQSAAGLEAVGRKVADVLCRQCDLDRADGVPTDMENFATHAICSEVLEHLAEPVNFLINAKRVIRPGGWLVVTVPGGPMSWFDKSIGHHRHYTKKLLSDTLSKAGLEIVAVAAAGFPTFNLYRCVVISRGRKLADDIGNAPSPLAQLAMTVFRGLLRFGFFNSPWGWQIVALARRSADTPAPYDAKPR